MIVELKFCVVRLPLGLGCVVSPFPRSCLPLLSWIETSELDCTRKSFKYHCYHLSMLFLIFDVSFELAVSETQKVVTKRTEMSWEIKCLSSVYCFGNQVSIKCLWNVVFSRTCNYCIFTIGKSFGHRDSHSSSISTVAINAWMRSLTWSLHLSCSSHFWQDHQKQVNKPEYGVHSNPNMLHDMRATMYVHYTWSSAVYTLSTELVGCH
jgi:hypothetical protein